MSAAFEAQVDRFMDRKRADRMKSWLQEKLDRARPGAKAIMVPLADVSRLIEHADHAVAAAAEPTPTKGEETLHRIAALMGSHEEWPGADMLEWIAYEITRSGLYSHSISDQYEIDLRHWREVAEGYGFAHDGDPDEEDEDDEE